MTIVSHKRMVLEELNRVCADALEGCGSAAEGHAKDYCPVKTGTLRDSLTHMPEGDRREAIGTDTDYAIYVELGHHQEPGRYVPAIGKRLVASWVAPRPFLRPALENHQSEYKGIIEDAFGG